MATVFWRSTKSNPARYVIAGLAIAVALVAARAVRPFLGNFSPFLIALPVVAFVVWCCGFRPALMAVGLTAFGAKYWFLPPLHSIRVRNAAELVSLLTFLFASAGIVALGESSRRENEKLLIARGELEDKVKKRTAELAVANENLSELTARLLQLQDDERRRIARDLHDSVGQTMAIMNMNLAEVEVELERMTKTINTVKDLRGLVRETSTNIRTISYLLHPPLLDERGLSSALPWYVEGFSGRSSIKVDLELPDDLGRLSRDSEIAIFRVVQECLTNIHRHSGSATAKIRVTYSDDDICLEVTDQGKGIPSEKLHEMTSGGTPGVGIRGMRERIRQLGGSLRINADGSSKGTAVIARLPLICSDTSTGVANDELSIGGGANNSSAP
jgi:signal transduction histidine kinase